MIGSYLSPLGWISFWADDQGVYELSIDQIKRVDDDHPIIHQTKQALNRYFNHQTETFDVPVHYLRGTLFQQRVWDALKTIPYGTTWSYQTLAETIGHPRSYRAVGQACKRNPIGIIVPCHRVIGKDGSMTGYSGKAYVDLKEKLIRHERKHTHA